MQCTFVYLFPLLCTCPIVRSFIPDEHTVWCPEQLLQCMLAHIHYMPDHWRGNANKSETRDEVAQLFQYKAVRHGVFFYRGTHHSHSRIKNSADSFFKHFMFFILPKSGVYLGGVAEPYCYTLYSHLPSEEQVLRDH